MARSGVYWGSNSVQKLRPRSCTQPRKSSGVILFGWVSNGSSGFSSITDENSSVKLLKPDDPFPTHSNTTTEVVWRDFIWMGEQRIIRLQQFHRRVLVRDARKRTIHLPCTLFCGRQRRRDQGRIWCIVEFIPGELPLVLHDECSTLRYIIEQPLIRSRQFRPKFVRAHPDHDGMEGG